MNQTALVIGYGRAGKRHAKLAASFGFEVVVYDPYLPVKTIEADGYRAAVTALESGQDDTMYLRRILNAYRGGIAVICTPPKCHLWQIETCLEYDFKVLCEKPLCDIGQLTEAETLKHTHLAPPVMIAYNYRYHPLLVNYQNRVHSFEMICRQHRPELPEWGLLLDHVSHDLDIMRMLTGHDLKIIEAEEIIVKAEIETWLIDTCLGRIFEQVELKNKVERVALIKTPITLSSYRKIIIDPDPQMFTDMWGAFLNDDFYPDLSVAIETQKLLERCYQLNRRKNVNGGSLPKRPDKGG